MRKLATLLVLMFLVPTPAARAASSLRLNEILAGPARDWDGSGALSTRDDEWVEVVNTGGTPLDLTGHLITDGDRLPTIPPSPVALEMGEGVETVLILPTIVRGPEVYFTPPAPAEKSAAA